MGCERRIFPRKRRKALKTVGLRMLSLKNSDGKKTKNRRKRFSPANGAEKPDKYCILGGAVERIAR